MKGIQYLKLTPSGVMKNCFNKSTELLHTQGTKKPTNGFPICIVLPFDSANYITVLHHSDDSDYSDWKTVQAYYLYTYVKLILGRNCDTVVMSQLLGPVMSVSVVWPVLSYIQT